MPLSKARDRERKRLAKIRLENDALQSKSRGLKEEPRHILPSNSNLIQSASVIPKLHPRYGEFSSIADQVHHLYPDGRLPNCPDGRYR